MPLILLVLFVGVPLLEVYVLVLVGRQIGALPAVGLLLAVSLLGAALVRREGVRAWRRFSAAAAAGGMPAKEVADGALVLVGGTLLLTPGYVTDALGLLLVLPPTRALVRRALTGWAARRLVAGSLLGGGLLGGGLLGGGLRGGGRAGGPGSGRTVIDGEVVRGDGPEDDPGTDDSGPDGGRPGLR